MVCHRCKGAGWLYAADSRGEAVWESGPYGQQTKIVRCPCQQAGDVERRRYLLERQDGLTRDERLMRFDLLVRGPHNANEIDTIAGAVGYHRGCITLTGKPGTGKTTLLVCAVNEARERGLPAVYTTVSDLLEYLRKAYAPGVELNFDGRWELLVKAEVLALDELDEFNTTQWAMEKFLRLMDERWRRIGEALTICATNANLNSLPDKVASRLRDGRARIFHLQGADLRKFNEWEPA